MMPRTGSRTRRFGALALVGLFAVGMTDRGAYGEPPADPQITVVPDTGLVDGQTVTVSGTGFQSEQTIQIVECGAEVTTPPFIGATCSSYFVGVQADGDGNFGPVNMTVTTTITGSRWTKGHYVPATHDCAPTADCYFHAFSTSRGLRSANRHLGFD